MKYESVRGLRLPKIGFGTWNIGGGSRAQPQHDRASMRALLTALRLGYTHFDTAEMYAAGHSEELLGRAVRESGVDRGQLFIVSKVSPTHLDPKSIQKSCEGSLRRLGLDYVDMYLIHWPAARMNLKSAFESLNRLVRHGIVKHLGVSNFDMELLEESCRLSETPILTDQVPLSIKDRSYVRNGVLEYCQRHDILLTAYSPFEQGSLKLNEHLSSLAEAHSATPHQIALAWLCNQPRVITIPMSSSSAHQRENLQAADIELSPAELALLG